MFGIAYLVLVLALGSVLGGWALSIMWEWFIVPVFALPSLDIAQAIGLSCIVTILAPRQTQNNSGSKKRTFEVIIETSAQAFLVPLLTVGFGWIVYQFI